MAAVSRADLARVFWRSLWLQASWSFNEMQSLGFAHALEPVLRRRYQGEELCRVTGRYLEFFNTNPILGAAIIGAAVHVEMAEGSECATPGPVDSARRTREVLMGPYGAIGDSFFWGAARPCAVLLALLAAVAGAGWAPWLVLGLFGGLNLAARVLFFALGVRHGVDVVTVVQRLDLLRWAGVLRAAAAVLAGAFVVASVSSQRWLSLGVPAVYGAGGLVVCALAGAVLVRSGVRPAGLVMLAAGVVWGSVWLT